MNYFEDNDGRVILQSGDRRLVLERKVFLKLEPGYKLPPGFKQRLYKDGRHCLFSEDSQVIAEDIEQSQIESYLAKLSQYKSALNQVDPADPVDPIESVGVNDFDRLQTTLRGTSAWARVFMAMSQSVRANAAGSLILLAITTTKNVGDLRVGFLSMLSAMNDQSSVTAFTAEEIQLIQDSLDSAGFEKSYFFMP